MTTLIPELPTPVPQSTDPVNFPVRADAFLGALPGFATAANTQAKENNQAAAAAAASRRAPPAAAGARRPTSGSRARAAWAAVSIFSPCTWMVEAQATMMKKATTMARMQPDRKSVV